MTQRSSPQDVPRGTCTRITCASSPSRPCVRARPRPPPQKNPPYPMAFGAPAASGPPSNTHRRRCLFCSGAIAARRPEVPPADTWRVRLPGAHPAHARHPNPYSGHPSRCFPPKHHPLLQPRLPNPCRLGGPRQRGQKTGKGGTARRIGENFAWRGRRAKFSHKPEPDALPSLST